MPVSDDLIRTAESFRHARSIVKAWGGLEEVLTWCRSECQGEWRWQLVEMSGQDKPGRYVFFFDREADYLAFVMKWT
jgi:hypothetical protein